MSGGKSSVSVIPRIFLIFGNMSLDDSKDLDSYKKSVFAIPKLFKNLIKSEASPHSVRYHLYSL